MRMCLIIIGGLFTMAMTANAIEKVIFDTDIGGDIDDAGALAVLHALADGAEVEILAVGVTNGHPLTVPYKRTVNAWYGRPELPIGTVRKNDAPFSSEKTGLSGLGLGGAIAINLCGGIVLGLWLLSGKVDVPRRGQVTMWSLVGILFVLGAIEMVPWHKGQPNLDAPGDGEKANRS